MADKTARDISLYGAGYIVLALVALAYALWFASTIDAEWGGRQLYLVAWGVFLVGVGVRVLRRMRRKRLTGRWE